MSHLPIHRATDVVVPAPAHDPAPVPDPHPRPHLVAVPPLQPDPSTVHDGEEGSLVAEYGLLAVVAATVAGVLIMWARGDALTSFFTSLLDHARSLVVGG